jgi:predicted DNA-binding protein (MmcQ/YjbR family)
MNGTLTRRQLCEMIDHSYGLIVKSLPKKIQAEIIAANEE